MYQFSACEWIKGEYAIISWSMAEKLSVNLIQNPVSQMEFILWQTVRKV